MKKQAKTLDRGQRLMAVTDLLLERLQQRIEAVDGPSAPSGELRQLTAAIKDIKSIQDGENERAPQVVVVEGMPEGMAQ